MAPQHQFQTRAFIGKDGVNGVRLLRKTIAEGGSDSIGYD
jgi:hypothetical protein